MATARQQTHDLMDDMMPGPDELRQALQVFGEAWATACRDLAENPHAAGIRYEQDSDTSGRLQIPLIAWWEDTGTKAHPIEATHASALAFVWPGAPPGVRVGKRGKVVFRSVQHPGTKAHPYITRALSEPDVLAAMEQLPLPIITRKS